MLIRVIDLETTGFEPPTAGVCEIGWCDLILSDEGATIGAPSQTFVDPGHSIPAETSAIHHIIDADLAGARPFAEVSRDVFFAEEVLRQPVVLLAAHNAAFEQRFCVPEITGPAHWICTYKCALRAWPDAPAHNNGTLRYWLKPEGLDRGVAALSHRAGPDAYVTAFTLREMLKLHSAEQLVAWSLEPALLVRCGFGKHRGTAWADVPSDYLRWVTGQQMDEDVLHTAKHHLAARGGR